MTKDAGGEMKHRLREDLRAAMKDRRSMEARVIRVLIAALDNAEAPPAHAGQPAQQHDFHEGSAEAQRLLLGSARVHEILLAEINERVHAAGELERLGMMDRAETLRAEALFIERYAEQ
jgi:uncharacterized protein YqeY